MSVVLKVLVIFLVFFLIIGGAMVAALILSSTTFVPASPTLSPVPTVSTILDSSQSTSSNPFNEPTVTPTYSNPFTDNQSDYTNPFAAE